MNIAAFLYRGLVWGLAGLSLLGFIDREPLGLALTAAGWIAGLFIVGRITARAKPPLYGWPESFATMLAIYLVLAMPW